MNALSLAFYGVMAFTSHLPCREDKDKAPNSTMLLVINFIIGFSLHMINFIVASFIEPSLRAIYHKGVYEDGLTTEVRRVFIASELIEYIFRLLFVLFSVFQIISLGDPGVKYCTEEVKALNMEADWCLYLAMSQLISMPLFAIWRYFVKFDDGRKLKSAEKNLIQY